MLEVVTPTAHVNREERGDERESQTGCQDLV